MTSPNPYSRYQNTAVQTATPTRLVIMLYDGAIRFLSQALPCMAASDFEGQSTFIGKAQAIVTHLRATLDFEAAPGIANDLEAMYVLLNNTLTDANINDRPEKVTEVISVLRELRAAWMEVDRQIQVEKGELKNAVEQMQLAAA